VTDADLDQVRAAFENNTLGPWRMAVNVSSEAGSLASMENETPAYNISKVGLNALTRMLALELRREGILVNSVCPGWVATEMGGPGGRPVADGAAGIVWAATLPDNGPTGQFLRDGRPLPW
jgi:NAD(P)-dependent dehydrogenase (short-subunit alcohol dehydrogenase family)